MTSASSLGPILDSLSVSLPQQASLLTRLVFRHAGADLSRSEAGILATLERGAQRITTLAEHEGLAQPTVTILVDRLEGRRWVERGHDPEDGRAVLVSLTDPGRDALARFRGAYRPLLRSHLTSLPARQVRALDAAGEALESLIEALQREPAR